MPTLHEPKINPTDLLARSRARWARNRSDIEEEIRTRQAFASRNAKEELHD